MSAGRRRSGNVVPGPSSEDQALNQIASEAESRLAAKRAARAEARSIRMKELEKQQKELDEEYERQYQNEDTPVKKKTPAVRSLSTGSPVEIQKEEMDGPVDSENTIKKLQDNVSEWEEKYRKAMVTIAQLDNEKQALVYHAENLKDKLEEEEDASTEARYELKERNKEIDRLKRQNKSLEREILKYQEALEFRDNFIAEKGLSLFEETHEDSPVTECDGENSSPSGNDASGMCASSAEDNKQPDANDSAAKRASLSDDKEVLVDQIKLLQGQVATMKMAGDEKHLEAPTASELEEIKREFGRQVNDMKIRVHKMEQENTRLEGLVMRLESQVKRYKSQAEAAESTEESLKLDKRKLQRELRKAQDEIIELQTAHDHIQKRYEKLKNRRKDES